MRRAGKNEIVTVPRQFAREIGADAAGGAGDEGKGRLVSVMMMAPN